MAEARKIRRVQASQGINGSCKSVSVAQRTTNTFKSQIFSNEEPVQEKSPGKRIIKTHDNGVLEGSKLQAATTKAKVRTRLEVSNLPAAGTSKIFKQVKTRVNKSNTSTVFDKPVTPSRRYNSNKPLDTRDIIGNGETEFYRKTVNEFIPVVEFSPAYKESSPYKRRQDEFHHGYMGDDFCKSRESDDLAKDLSTKQRLSLDLSSLFGSPLKQAHTNKSSISPQKYEQDSFTAASPIDKKKKWLSSDIFGVGTPVFKNLSQTTELKNTMELMTGQRHERSKSEMKVRTKKSALLEEELTARDRKMKHLRSSSDLSRLESPIADEYLISRSFVVDSRSDVKELKRREMQSDLHPADFYTRKNKTEVKDFIVRGVDEITLKDACKGVQVLKLEEKVDPLSGEFKGSARLQIKGSKEKINDIVLTLAEKGADCHTHKHKHGKNGSYVDTAAVYWTDAKIELEQPSRPVESHRMKKLRELESNGDLFGSHVGKMTKAWKQGSRLKSDKSLQTLFQIKRASNQALTKRFPLK